MAAPVVMSDREYLSCAETAKLVRKALAARFPGVRFSVRSHTYSGGASIHVRWVDGPSQAAVDQVADQFSGADFDGMIDLKHYRRHWLLPDGRVVLQSDPGTEGSRGVHPRVKGPGAEFGEITGARLVHFGADFIFCDRELSPAAHEQLRAIVEARGQAGQFGTWSMAVGERWHDFSSMEMACWQLAEYHAAQVDGVAVR